MNQFSLRTLSIAHDWVSQVVRAGDSVIDATVGNGHDTLFLAQLVGNTGRVYGYDLQQDAVDKTNALLAEQELKDEAIDAPLNKMDYRSVVQLHTACHSTIAEREEEVSAVMFNLGYLPSSDKAIITQSETTLLALTASLSLLKPKGLLTIVCYPGHAGGAEEASVVEQWTRELDSKDYSVIKVTPHNPRSQAPYLIAVHKGR